MKFWTFALLIVVSVLSPRYAQSIDLWVVDQDTDTVIGLDSSGAPVMSVDLPGSGFGTAVASDGSVWVSIAAEQIIVRVDESGLQTSFATAEPVQSLAAAADGTLWAVSSTTPFVHHYDGSGTLLGSSEVGAVPYGVAIAGSGRIWVTNAFGNSVTRIESDGSGAIEIPVGFYPTGIAVHPDGPVFVIEKTGVTVLDEDGAVISTQSLGVFPRGVTVALDGSVWISDQALHSVFELQADGTFVAEHEVGLLPWGIAASGDGTVSVLCRWAGEVWKLSDDGEVIAQTPIGYPNGFGDLSGLQLAMTVLPDADFDGDTAANLVESLNGADPLDASSSPVSFVRGDATRDGVVDVEDVWTILGFGPSSSCLEALDVDDDGAIDLSDAVGLLEYLFMAGPAPAAPFPDSSYDLSPVGGHGCVE